MNKRMQHLEAENVQLRRQLAEERKIRSGVLGVLRNENLTTGERVAALTLLLYAQEAKERGEMDADGWFRVPDGDVGGRANG